MREKTHAEHAGHILSGRDWAGLNKIRRSILMPKIEQKAQKTTDAVKIMDRMIGEDSDLRQLADEALVNAEVAQLIHELRIKAKLTQKQLAELVGTTQSVIARLEDADYEGHSLSMLQRIAAAVNKRLEVRFVSSGRKAMA
jgi:DNA-binding XRE family transcriptional regulator